MLKRISVRTAALLLSAALSVCGGDNGTAPSGGTLRIEDLVVGSGAVAVSGDTLTVHYTGSLTNGSVFDSSVGRAPFTFRLGAGQVIAGWDQGLVGMRVGGRRRLTIPPELGYGNRANGSIPANSTLRFDVDLLSIAGK
jgi:FKBP-type peptidyl-prolyl cis-trans isomerase